MPLVSVIVPTFNRAHCIARAIDSARAQSHSNLEIIVIDDGSTDETAALIRNRYAADPRVRCIRRENGGVSAARNTGLGQARGDFIAFLDSDDIWLPWKLELQICCFERYPHVGMVWSDMEALDQDGRVSSPKFLRAMYSCWNHYPDPRQVFPASQPLKDIAPGAAHLVGDAVFYSGDIFSHMIRGSLVHTSTVLLRRDRLERVRGFNERFKPSGEDFDFHLRTCHAGPVGFLDLATIQYQIGMADRLTRPEYHIHIATNFLRTIEPFVTNHRQDIRLSSAELNSVLAEAHHWIGEKRFWRQEMPEARRRLATSLRYRLRQPRVWKLLLASFLPFRWLSARRPTAPGP